MFNNKYLFLTVTSLIICGSHTAMLIDNGYSNQVLTKMLQYLSEDSLTSIALPEFSIMFQVNETISKFNATVLFTRGHYFRLGKITLTTQADLHTYQISGRLKIAEIKSSYNMDIDINGKKSFAAVDVTIPSSRVEFWYSFTNDLGKKRTLVTLVQEELPEYFTCQSSILPLNEFTKNIQIQMLRTDFKDPNRPNEYWVEPTWTIAYLAKLRDTLATRFTNETFLPSLEKAASEIPFPKICINCRAH